MQFIRFGAFAFTMETNACLAQQNLDQMSIFQVISFRVGRVAPLAHE